MSLRVTLTCALVLASLLAIDPAFSFTKKHTKHYNKLVDFDAIEIGTKKEKVEPKAEVKTEKEITTIKWSGLDVKTKIANQNPEALCFDFDYRNDIKYVPLVSAGALKLKLDADDYHLVISSCRLVRLIIPALTLLSPPQLIIDFTVSSTKEI